MRDPYKVVEGRPTMQTFGDKVNNLWRQFVNEHPKAKEVAETYGTKENEFTPGVGHQMESSSQRYGWRVRQTNSQTERSRGVHQPAGRPTLLRLGAERQEIQR